MKNRYLVISLVVLIVLFISLVGLRLKKKGVAVSKSSNNSVFIPSVDSSAVAAIPNKDTVSLPVPLSDPSVQQILLHYFFTGQITKISNQGGTPTLFFEKSKGIPSVSIANSTRVSKISPPYSQNTSSPISAKDLKVGDNVIVSADYDIKSKSWSIADIFLPTDKNK